MELSFAPLFTRRFLRRTIKTPCQVVAEDGFRLLGEETLDLSEEGMLIGSSARVVVGESVILSVKMPGGSSWIDAEGTVQRVLWRGMQRRAIGVEFKTLSGVDRALLTGGLYRAAPALPWATRTPRRDYASALIQLAV
ncbi:MAG: hypothetical protein ACI9KE_000996 [Polyangiales bacterium]|jgi:hypothetical protein